MRLLATLLLALILGQAISLTAATVTDACGEDCPEDAEGDECPPICPSCTCLSHARASVLLSNGAVSFIDEPPVVIAPATIATHLTSPDPREILHVPKTALG